MSRLGGGGGLLQSDPSNKPFQQEVFSNQGLFGNVSVEIIKGDITIETTDAIVNSTSQSFDFSGAVSKAILRAGGQGILAECKSKGNTLLLIKSRNRKCKKRKSVLTFQHFR